MGLSQHWTWATLAWIGSKQDVTFVRPQIGLDRPDNQFMWMFYVSTKWYLAKISSHIAHTTHNIPFFYLFNSIQFNAPNLFVGFARLTKLLLPSSFLYFYHWIYPLDGRGAIGLRLCVTQETAGFLWRLSLKVLSSLSLTVFVCLVAHFWRNIWGHWILGAIAIGYSLHQWEKLAAATWMRRANVPEVSTLKRGIEN